MLETVIRGGLVVLPQGPGRVDLGIGVDGRFHAITAPGELEGKHIVEADGLVILPGAVEPHVHICTQFGEARTYDDFYIGTIPAAMGGTTTLVEFAIPQVERGYGVRLTVGEHGTRPMSTLGVLHERNVNL